jgi:hypothetical protein
MFGFVKSFCSDMTPLFKKLNFKNHTTVLSMNHPDSFLPELKAMAEITNVVENISKVKSISFAIVFATKQTEINKAAEQIAKKAEDDAVLWFCYPKGTSKKYKCDFNRDTGWEKLGELGYEGVRAVAIDEDWSALRFRKAEHIKIMTRSFAMTEAGTKKVAAAKKK